MIPKSTNYWVVEKSTGKVIQKSSKHDAKILQRKMGIEKYQVELHY
jgi:hypothetical protein